jgi:hypothetical protein
MLKKNGDLDEFMKLDPQKYLKDTGYQNYHVELDQLRKDTSAFVEKHQEFYDRLIEKYKEILNKYSPA